MANGQNCLSKFSESALKDNSPFNREQHGYRLMVSTGTVDSVIEILGIEIVVS